MTSRPTAKNPYVELAKAEFPYQRMHREEIPPHRAPVVDDQYQTVHKRSFTDRGPQPRQVPQFTVGEKNALGTSRAYHKLTLDELRIGQMQLTPADGKPSWGTTYGQAFGLPNQNDRFQGHNAPRGGIAPRMPYSEVERNFGSLDSTGTMPGADGGRFDTRSEYQQHFAEPGAAARVRREPEFTLKFSNDIGSDTKASKVPPTMLNATHFDFGTYAGKRFETTTYDAHGVAPVFDPKQDAAGREPPLGPSAVERGFREPISSKDYNIVTTGHRLGGRLNTEAAHAARTAFGKQQFPSVDPAMRGPTGTRQAFDIITGVERPRARW